MNRTVSEIINEQRYLISMATISLFTRPHLNSRSQFLESVKDFPFNGFLKLSHRGDGEDKLLDSQLAHYVNLKDTFEFFDKKPINNIILVNNLIIGSILTIGDLLGSCNLYGSKKPYRDSISPEIEFFRHIRNGVAHGNRFNLKDGEPKFLANFNRLTISIDLNEKNVFPAENSGFIEFGDILEIYEIIAEQLKIKGL